MGRIVTWLQQCSENPEFGTTLARRLNQSRASAVLQSNLIAIKFGTAEARRLNWASVSVNDGAYLPPLQLTRDIFFLANCA